MERRTLKITIAGGSVPELRTEVMRLSYDCWPADTVELARALLGKVLVRQCGDATAMGRIVETEAYLHDDPACHAFRGMTQRNRSLFLERGHAYVYLCYGTSYLLNVSSEVEGIGAGVLLRALEPMCGIAQSPDLTRGPGRLTRALGVNLSHDGLNLFSHPQLWIGSDRYNVESVGESVRIGITKAADQRLRYFIQGNRCVSGPRRLNTCRAV